MSYWGNQKPPPGTPVNWGHPLAPRGGAMWPMWERCGSHVHECVGGSHGRITTGPSPARWLGDGLYLDGADDRVAVADSIALEPSDITISVRINPISWSHNVTATAILAKRPMDGATGWFFFCLTTGAALQWDWGGFAHRWTTGYSPPLGAWTHLVVTRNSAGRQLYVNGALRSSTGAQGDSTLVPSAAELRIGFDSGLNQYAFKGWIDLPMIYPQALPASAIAQLYAEPYCMFLPPSRQPYYSLPLLR